MTRRYQGAGRRLYRDRENGIFLGVCAGIAEYFDLRTTGVRIGAVILLLVFFWPTVLIYLTAGYLLHDRPLYYDGPNERCFWRSTGAEYHRRGY
jgi:phage shock protein C